jgi:type I restriction enzyme M protein
MLLPLSEVAENDYNLNIPSYVDTFEEEEQIDIDTVATEIESLDSELEENETLIASFVKN